MMPISWILPRARAMFPDRPAIIDGEVRHTFDQLGRRVDALVGALNATSLAEIASIDVGGRPSALALNRAANTVLVLDPSQKTITEIDGDTNLVLGTTKMSIADTPTALQVDPTNGRIVVTAVATAPAPMAIELIPVLWLFRPIAIAPVCVATALSPMATEEAPLALLLKP